MDRRSIVVGGAFAALCWPVAAQVPDPSIDSRFYTGRTVVTGREEPNRLKGFGLCLEYVLVKLSGDPSLRHDPRVAVWVNQAQHAVERYSYRDVKEGKPLIDEQGTYDRPHVLTVVFARDVVEGYLAVLGRKVWPWPRPKLAVFVSVASLKESFALASNGEIDRSADMRESLSAASDHVGLSMVLPTDKALAALVLRHKALVETDAPELLQPATDLGAEAVLAGHMAFQEEALGWVADWRMPRGGSIYRWGIKGVNFDAVFRNGLLGAAQVLSGHGAPQPLGLDSRFAF